MSILIQASGFDITLNRDQCSFLWNNELLFTRREVGNEEGLSHGKLEMAAKHNVQKSLSFLQSFDTLSRKMRKCQVA